MLISISDYFLKKWVRSPKNKSIGNPETYVRIFFLCQIDKKKTSVSSLLFVLYCLLVCKIAALNKRENYLLR